MYKIPNPDEFSTMRYLDLCHSIDNLKLRLTKVMNLYMDIELLETVIDRVPQAVLQLSLLFASLNHSKLRTFLAGFLESAFKISDPNIIFGLNALLIFWGVTKTIIYIK